MEMSDFAYHQPSFHRKARCLSIDPKLVYFVLFKWDFREGIVDINPIELTL